MHAHIYSMSSAETILLLPYNLTLAFFFFLSDCFAYDFKSMLNKIIDSDSPLLFLVLEEMLSVFHC